MLFISAVRAKYTSNFWAYETNASIKGELEMRNWSIVFVDLTNRENDGT